MKYIKIYSTTILIILFSNLSFASEYLYKHVYLKRTTQLREQARSVVMIKTCSPKDKLYVIDYGQYMRSDGQSLCTWLKVETLTNNVGWIKEDEVKNYIRKNKKVTKAKKNKLQTPTSSSSEKQYYVYTNRNGYFLYSKKVFEGTVVEVLKNRAPLLPMTPPDEDGWIRVQTKNGNVGYINNSWISGTYKTLKIPQEERKRLERLEKERLTKISEEKKRMERERVIKISEEREKNRINNMVIAIAFITFLSIFIFALRFFSDDKI